MLALRLHPDGSLRAHEEPTPDPAPDETLVRVTAVGLCGSDRHWILEREIGDARLTEPLVLGHEFGGVVETGEHRGRRVAVDPAAPCRHCKLCTTGRENLCLEMRFAGHGRTDGGLREYVAWPQTSIHPLSDDLPDGDEALVEPLAIAIHALDLGPVESGATVAVIGCGPIGLLIIALARQAGASTIVAADPLPHRLDAARDFGATDTTEPEDGIFAGAADVAFEAAGEQAAVDHAVDVAAPGASVVLVGIPSEDRTSFSASVARRKGLNLKLTRRSTASSFGRAVALAEKRVVDLSSLVSLRVPLANVQPGIDGLIDRRGIKVVVEPGRTASVSGAERDSREVQAR